MSGNTTRFALNPAKEEAWPCLRDALAKVGCDESIALAAWDHVRNTDSGQLDPRSGTESGKAPTRIQDSLNAGPRPSPEPASDRLVLTSKHDDRFNRAKISTVIGH